MRKCILLLLSGLMLACGNSDSGMENNSEIPPELKSAQVDSAKVLVVNAFQQIWSNLDSTAVDSLHTDDFLLLENGEVWTNDSVKGYLNEEMQRAAVQGYQRLNRFEFIQAAHHGQSIWVAYHNYGTWVKEGDTLGSVHWLESAVAIRDAGKWKLQQLHSTYVRN